MGRSHRRGMGEVMLDALVLAPGSLSRGKRCSILWLMLEYEVKAYLAAHKR